MEFSVSLKGTMATFFSRDKTSDLIKAAGLALQIDKAKMVFERKARRERHTMHSLPVHCFIIASL